MILALAATLFLQQAAPTPIPVANRFAVLISANTGADNEQPLHYAALDAARLGDLLERYGDFPAHHVWILHEPIPQDVTLTLMQIDALRRSEGLPADNSFLLVYYAGHADASAMHLGKAKLMWPELIAATRRSGVKDRVLVVDACRSGSVADGGVAEHHLEQVSQPENLGSLAIFSAVSADERSRESAELGGALFTHHLLAALQGAGDINGDGKVSLYEALAYSSARTAPGHETPVGGAETASHRYRLVGHGDTILTTPSAVPSLATLHLAAPGTYVIRRDSATGTLAMQAVVNAAVRTLWLPAGRYFIERRAGHVAYEGSVDLAPNGGAMIEDDTFAANNAVGATAVPEGSSPFDVPATLLSLGAGSGARLTPGVGVPWTAHALLAHRRDALVVDLQLAWSQSTNATSSLRDGGAALGLRGATDLGPVMLSLGLRAGARYLSLRLPQTEEAHRLAPQAAAVARVDVLLSDHLFIGAEGSVAAVLVGNNGLTNAAPLLWQPTGTLDVGVIF